MTDKVRYVFHERAVSVEERFVTVRVKKNPDGTASEERESQGWFLRLVGSSSIYLGIEKPPFAAGDMLRMTLERKDP